MARQKKVYVIFKGNNGVDVAIKMFQDIYKGLATALGCTVLGAGDSPPTGTVIVKTINDALNNGVASVRVSYTKSGETRSADILCSATNADTVIPALASLKYRNNPIGEARFSR